LKSNQVGLIAAAGEATAELEQLQLSERVCIVLGAESSGLSEQVRALEPQMFRIRTAASVESLNVAAAAAIAISRISERMKLI
ncbi:MAG: TrmH family RNA methyltransferase, partial [bacterium]